MYVRYMSRRRAAKLCAVTAALAVPAFAAPAAAGELACRPHIKEVTFARAVYVLPGARRAGFRRDLDAWAATMSMSVSGAGLRDPDRRPPLEKYTAIYQSPRYGVVLTAETSNRDNLVRIAAGNNCWAPTEDWRPYWRKLNATVRDFARHYGVSFLSRRQTPAPPPPRRSACWGGSVRRGRRHGPGPCPCGAA